MDQKNITLNLRRIKKESETCNLKWREYYLAKLDERETARPEV